MTDSPRETLAERADGSIDRTGNGWRIVCASLLALAISGGVALVVMGYSPGFELSGEMVAETIRDLGMWGQAGIIALMVVHSFVPFPAEFVAIAAGIVYGAVWGTVLTWTGAMIGAMLSFALTRTLGRPFAEALLNPRQKKALDAWTEDQGATTLLVSRFIPVIAFNLINYAAGLTRVSWWTFFWTTGIGILPLTFVMVIMGTKMNVLPWTHLFGLAAFGMIAMGVGHWYLRRKGWLGRNGDPG